MDHSPGQRQYADRSKYRDYYQGKYHLTNEEMDKFEEEQMALAAAWSQPQPAAHRRHLSRAKYRAGQPR